MCNTLEECVQYLGRVCEIPRKSVCNTLEECVQYLGGVLLKGVPAGNLKLVMNRRTRVERRSILFDFL